MARRSTSDTPEVSRKTLKPERAPYALRDRGNDEDDDGPRKKKVSRADKAAADDTGKDAQAEEDGGETAARGADKSASKGDDRPAAAEAAKPEAAPAKADLRTEAEPSEPSAAEPAPTTPASGSSEPGAAPPPAGDNAILVPAAAVDLAADPEAPAPAPGLAPAGDSRSLRRLEGGREEFVLIYRDASFLVTRRGEVGKQGRWSRVEYPNQGAAAHAYAQECSRLTGEGFRDLRG